jgi:hypothetical protein
VTALPPEAVRFLAGHPLGETALRRALDALGPERPVDVRVTKSQIALRRRRGFAYLWLPGRWLAHPAADVVLSIVLPYQDASPRWKEVAHPAPTTWTHHLELYAAEDVDAQVAAWLHTAYDAAA